ncbi:MAG: glycosidase [Limisphaera sp.]|nr:MAG: glycosidase [Limisphaera sp.]
MKVTRTTVMLRPDSTRVFFRPLELRSRERMLRILARILALEEAEAEAEAERIWADFAHRHRDTRRYLEQQCQALESELPTDARLSPARRLLIGAYFTQEYALEAAALFNPSIVPHPDQSNLPEGSLRFILSLRAVGEGHISSIVFRTGRVDSDGAITIDPAAPRITAAQVQPNPTYEKRLFQRKLAELGLDNEFTRGVLAQLEENFRWEELEEAVERALRHDRYRAASVRPSAQGMLALARANYEIAFDESTDLSQRLIFPTSQAEKHGIEDARFVRFMEDDGQVVYYATYTAFDGQVSLPQLLETRDFLRFRVNTLNGPAVENKGFALFPRRIGGHYYMLGRQDGENLYVMCSDMLHFWYEKRLLLRPTYPWEFVQVGNCGSPIETEAGWLVLTHGVGPMRRYSIGAILLDRDNPEKVLGRLRQPLLSPTETERHGYVPNVLYTCGALVHAGKLIIPYAMSDYCTSFAVVELRELLEALT